MAAAEEDLLRRTATAFGIAPEYVDADGVRRTASPEVLLALISALGHPVDSAARAREALEAELRARASRPLEPVVIGREGEPLAFDLRLPAGSPPGPVKFTLVPREVIPLVPGRPPESAADEEALTLILREEEAAGAGPARRGGEGAIRIESPWRPAAGYHRLTVESGSLLAESVVVVAPERVPGPGAEGRRWGIFFPLHAAWRPGREGAGTYDDLAGLARWSGAAGGSFVGTLPLLAPLTEGRQDWSPYAPSSRLFYSELFIDPAAAGAGRLPEPAAGSAGEPDLVDYPGVWDSRRAALSAVAARDEAAVRRAMDLRPDLADYARFGAAAERQGRCWRQWPGRMQEGRLEEGDFDPAAARELAFLQLRAGEQLEAAGRRAREAGAPLYADLPLGVHPDGYDAWRYRLLFASGASMGAPPDGFFRGGQDWGMAPLHPGRLREDGYRYLALVLRRTMANAGLVRIDHVMGLHRIYLVPRGVDAAAGTYLNYHHDELYAVLCLEAARAGCAVVGEDLGTVPDEVRQEMDRRGLARMHVFQIEAEISGGDPAPPPRRSLACLNTHDMPPFAAFWSGADLDQNVAAGFLDPGELAAARKARASLRRRLSELLGAGGAEEKDGAGEALKACLARLAAGPAALLQITLEDLWQEERPQNMPGTGAGQPNWRRRSRLSLDQIQGDPAVRQILGLVDGLRRRDEREVT